MTQTTHRTHDIAREAEAVAQAAEKWAEEQDIRAKRIRKGTMRTKAAEAELAGFLEEHGGMSEDTGWADPANNECEADPDGLSGSRTWACAHPDLAKQARDRANAEAKEAAKEAKEARGRADRALAHAIKHGYVA